MQIGNQVECLWVEGNNTSKEKVKAVDMVTENVVTGNGIKHHLLKLKGCLFNNDG
ncbi:MAG: hypothetical protein ABJB76_04260 [Candidatus Nitrosocosmicus sp.]